MAGFTSKPVRFATVPTALFAPPIDPPEISCTPETVTVKDPLKMVAGVRMT